MRVCVKESIHAKESMNVSKTLLEMAFFLDKKQKKPSFKIQRREQLKKQRQKGKRKYSDNTAKEIEVVAERSNSKSFLSAQQKCQIACLHYLERLSRINKKYLNTWGGKKKSITFLRTDSSSTQRHFHKEITFLELRIKHITLQSEDQKTHRKLKIGEVNAAEEQYGTKKCL